MTEYFNRKSTTRLRRDLRRNMTRAEVLLWAVIKDRKLEGCRFRRQFGIGEYVIDFFCPQLNLGIEVDGDSHYTSEGKEHDRIRKEFLDSLGVQIVRVTNPDVYENMNGVWELLRRTVLELSSQKPPPAPPLTKGGQGGLSSRNGAPSTMHSQRQSSSLRRAMPSEILTPPTPTS